MPKTYLNQIADTGDRGDARDGLFAARIRSHNGFNRKPACDHIPQTIGILRDILKFISHMDLPEQMGWIIDYISVILAGTDVYKILDQLPCLSMFRYNRG